MADSVVVVTRALNIRMGGGNRGTGWLKDSRSSSRGESGGSISGCSISTARHLGQVVDLSCSSFESVHSSKQDLWKVFSQVTWVAEGSLGPTTSMQISHVFPRVPGPIPNVMFSISSMVPSC